MLLFSDSVILPQIIPNCHNRILTPLHAILYICGLTHPPAHPKRRQHSAGTRESALYAFHPPTRARVYSGRDCKLYNIVPYYRPPPLAADRHITPPTTATSSRQPPPLETADRGRRTNQNRPKGERGEEPPGAACSTGHERPQTDGSSSRHQHRQRVRSPGDGPEQPRGFKNRRQTHKMQENLQEKFATLR